MTGWESCQGSNSDWHLAYSSKHILSYGKSLIGQFSKWCSLSHYITNLYSIFRIFCFYSFYFKYYLANIYKIILHNILNIFWIMFCFFYSNYSESWISILLNYLLSKYYKSFLVRFLLFLSKIISFESSIFKLMFVFIC